MKAFEFCTKQTLRQLTASRAGENKLGQCLETLSGFDALENYSQRFVLLGVAEDIGIRANLGRAGAAGCWDEVLKALCNVQSNTFFEGNDLLIAGCLNPVDLMQEARHLHTNSWEDLERLRKLTGEVDLLLYPIIERIVRAGKTPIIIGGGHNNAYANLVGSSKALGTRLSCLNIDPHADFRALEGRHSGNGFSYAHVEDALHKYFVWGLHEGYNNQTILDTFEKNATLAFHSFEQLLSKDLAEKDSMLKHALAWLDKPIGLELDLDSIEGFPASALNVSGFNLNEVRHYVRTVSALTQPVYFHICEGAPALAEEGKSLVGKRIGYLIVDFIKAHAVWNS